MKLLSRGNPKVEKNSRLRVLGAILHLAPARLSGWNVCAASTAGCRAACLHTAGHPMMMRGKDRARRERTRLFFTDRPAFMLQLHKEIRAHVRRAARLGYTPSVRLNGTSDIRWESVPLVLDGEKLPNIMAAFPHVEFYDYTKIKNRKNVPPNYHLTLSRSETTTLGDIQAAIRSGLNVAVVFEKVPEKWNGIPVFCGDDTDYRPGDPRGVIVGLTPKGSARRDQSGFVVRAERRGASVRSAMELRT